EGVHLGGRQPRAVVLAHRLDHVVDEALHRGGAERRGIDALGDFPEHRMAEPRDPASLRTSAVQRLIDDMIETMREYDGAGLAATQVHTLKQIAVLEVLGNPRYPDAPAVPLMVLV